MILTDGIHLMTDGDNLEELHQFAEKIGLKREWFQNKPLHPHYDLKSVKFRLAAYRAGVVVISSQELARRCSKLFAHQHPRVLLQGDHSWAGFTGELVRIEQTPFGKRPIIALDNGIEAMVMKPSQMKVVGLNDD